MTMRSEKCEKFEIKKIAEKVKREKKRKFHV
jgi:hypothetical protein